MSDILPFIRQRDYKFVKDIGRGGTGITKLLLDETIHEHFVCKKYAPENSISNAEYFPNFVREIKLLHLLYHRNIVRIFNHYLYPTRLTGFIIMEFVDGYRIDSYLKANPERINSIFAQTIEGFRYLEEVNILHRDIRPANILVSKEDVVKIIDFGFGKKIDFLNPDDKSITLNWAFTPPDEFTRKIYDEKTEIYFVAKLFDSIIEANGITEFAYTTLLQKMMDSYAKRVGSFKDVADAIVENGSARLEFDEEQKNVYARFVGNLQSAVTKVDSGITNSSDLDKIVQRLETLGQNSVLEFYIQSIPELVGIFISGKYWYNKGYKFETEILDDFLNLMKILSVEKQKIVLVHISRRLDKIERDDPSNDELPF